MPRATNSPASRARRKRVIKASKVIAVVGPSFSLRKDMQMKAKYWAYRDRKTRKRNFRSLWITRLNAAVRAGDYLQPIHRRIESGRIVLDRKVLADLAVQDIAAFCRSLKGKGSSRDQGCLALGLFGCLTMEASSVRFPCSRKLTPYGWRRSLRFETANDARSRSVRPLPRQERRDFSPERRHARGPKGRSALALESS